MIKFENIYQQEFYIIHEIELHDEQIMEADLAKL